MSSYDQGRVFLDEVLASPEDDAPRLIYADYLEEFGDPRGEFIRLQCEQAQMEPFDSRFLDVSHRCSDILMQHGENWAAELKQDVRKSEFSRGFIDKITMRARAFVKQGHELYRSVPINWLRLNYVKGAGEALAGTEALNCVRSLDLGGLSIPDGDMRALLMSENLQGLRALNMAHYESVLPETFGSYLGEMPAAKHLRWLEVPSGADFLQAMSRKGSFPKLEHLSIGTTYTESTLRGITGLQTPSLKSLKCAGTLRVADTEVLVQFPLRQLEILNFESSRIPARGLQLLAERGALDAVRELNLRNCGLGTRAGGVLFAGDRLKNCETLHLSMNRNLGSGGRSKSFLEYLSGHQTLAKLKHLSIGGLLPGDLSQLVEIPHLAGLRALALDSIRLGARDLAALAASPVGESLQSLRLSGCEASLDAIIQMASERPFPKMITLELGNGYDEFSSLDELRVGALAESGSFPTLQLLQLDFMELSSRTLRTIAESAVLPELRQISYLNMRTSKKSIDAVMTSDRLPKLAKLKLKGSTGFGDRLRLYADYGNRIE